MTDSNVINLFAVFSDLEPAADAVEKLRALGVHDDRMNVVSGVPVTEAMMGRPLHWTNVPRIATGGAILGFGVGVFLAYISPFLYPYPIRVSTQGYVPGPPTVVVLFEMTMLFMLLSTFLGVFLDSSFPNYRPMRYMPEISDGKIAILIECPYMDETKITDALKKLGAESVKPAEARPL